ncbi:MAG: glycosyltransferase [Oxalobacteraceae bacterium]|jgi:glycosyltransferase involved in cell wall biosynthesis|nr:MAG: glycosyltransferase [Oxalobacteraceae bacterium]
MRILLVEPNLIDNGAIRVSLDRALRWKSKSEVTILVTSPDTHGDKNLIDVPAGLIVKFAYKKTFNRALAIVASVKIGLKMAKNADVIVAGREIDNGLLVASLIALISRKPLAVTVQSSVGDAMQAYLPPRIQSLTKQAYRRVDLAVCVSAGLVPSVMAVGVSRQNIKVVLNGLDYEGIRTLAKVAPAVDLPTGRFITAVGRLAHQKGFDLLIRAHAAALKSGAPEHSLVLVGEGPDLDQLKALTLELDVENTVIFTGFLNNPHAVVARGDAFVMSSRWEGFSLVLAEALAVKVPIIAANCVSGPSEILDNGKFGWLVPVDDVAAMAAAITSHLREPDVLKTKAASGSASLAQRFNLDGAADHHLLHLEQLQARMKRINKPRATAE